MNTSARRNGKPRDPADWRPRLARLLRQTFGLKRLRDGQAEVIAHVMTGKPTLAVMPTGAGKSLCYQLPALLLPGTTLVISPLIALMKDQCDKLRELGIAAVEVNSGLRCEELRDAESAIAAGEAKIVFTTPERLVENGFLERVAAHPVSLLVIDEAHCISQWGHDFRPAFLEIGGVLPRLSRPAILALTATATEAVITDIARQMNVGRFAVVNTGMYRPNLHYRVIQVTNEAEKVERAVACVKTRDGPGLVYTATVKAAEAVHAALVAAGVDAVLYHGKLGAAQRKARQDAFMQGEARVMVATNAFGLGIDKADTRFVVHFQMPAGLDAYYQESGRAGRDGAEAECTLLFLYSDRTVQQFFLAGRYPAKEDVASLYRALQRDAGGGPPWTLEALQATLDRPRTKVQVALRLLRYHGVVIQGSEGRLRLGRAGLDDEALEQLLSAYQEKRESDRAMLERMVFYGQTGRCRWKVLLDNFGEGEGFEKCGGCDNCVRIAAAVADAQRESAGSPALADAAPHRARAETPVAWLPAVGERVRVPRYGLGVVEAVDSEGITVAFAEGSRRVFLAAFVRRANPKVKLRKAARVAATAT